MVANRRGYGEAFDFGYFLIAKPQISVAFSAVRIGPFKNFDRRVAARFPDGSIVAVAEKTQQQNSLLGGVSFGLRLELIAKSRHQCFSLKNWQFMNDSNGYSSTIHGWLEANGHRFALSQVGPDYCVVRHSIATPPTDAELVIEIDGNHRRQRVFLPAGISASSTLVKFADQYRLTRPSDYGSERR